MAKPARLAQAANSDVFDRAALERRIQELEELLHTQNTATARLQLQFQIAEILTHAQAIIPAMHAVLAALAATGLWDVAVAWLSKKTRLDTRLEYANPGFDTTFLQADPATFDATIAGSLPDKCYNAQQVRWQDDPQLPAFASHGSNPGFQNYIAFPLTAGHTSYGVLLVARQSYQPLNPDFHATCLALGRSLGHFIQARRYQAELHDSNDRLSQVQRIAQIGYWALNPATGEMFCNDGAINALGRPRHRLPRTLNEYIAMLAEEDREAVSKAFGTVARPPYTPQHFEHTLEDATGSVRTLEIRCKAELDNRSELVRITGSVQNVSDQRTVQMRLASSEKLWELVFRHSPVPGVVSDRATGELIAVNDQFADWLNRPKTALLGLTTIDIGFWNNLEEREEVIRLANAQGHLRNHETRHRINGVLHTVLISLEFFDLDHRPCLFTQYVDITRRKELENELALRATAIEQAADAMLLLDSNGVIRSVNPAFTAITGYLPNEALGQTMENLLNLPSGKHGNELFRWLAASLNDNGHWKGELWAAHKNGNAFSQLLSISAVRHESARTTNYVVVFSDNSERKHYENKLIHDALHDRLTGLPNRSLLHEHLEKALTRAQRNESKVAVLFADLDHFKQVNDDHGHDVGDDLLREVAQRMRRALRESDLVARLGGDEFVMVIEGVNAPCDARCVAEKLIASLCQPVHVAGHALQVGSSIGIALWPDHAGTASMLVRRADEALYQAKNNGRNRYACWGADGS